MHDFIRPATIGICLALLTVSCSAVPQPLERTSLSGAIHRSQGSPLVAKGRVLWKDGHSYTEFDIAGADLGTFAYAIDDAGDVAGTFVASQGGNQGFLRAQNGDVSVVNPPGLSQTFVKAMNSAGEIAGYSGDQGFVRAPDGAYTVFSPPGASYTRVFDINDGGDVAGYFSDSSAVYHGFVRLRDGSIAVFDAPGAGTQPNSGTDAYGINNQGDVSGSFFDASGQHGYERFPDGTMTTFDIPKTWAGRADIDPISINSSGLTTGFFDLEANPGGTDGFVRSSDGHLNIFAMPNSAYTIPAKINDRGQVIGFSTNSGLFAPAFGFLRGARGGVTIISAPGAQSTTPIGIDHLGRVVGSFAETGGGLWHGFIWK